MKVQTQLIFLPFISVALDISVQVRLPCSRPRLSG